MIVRVSSTLPLPAEVVGELMGKPALLQHITWPILSVRGLLERVDNGQQMVVRLAPRRRAALGAHH